MKRWLLIAAVFLGLAAPALADSVQPIVPTGQVVYGSFQKLITSTADVTIDTTTHRVTASKGIKTSTITFADGTSMASTSTINATAAWGSITGTIGSQADLQAQFATVGASTATIASTVAAHGTLLTALAASTTTLQTQITALGVSTVSLASSISTANTNITALGVSTVAIQAQLNSVGVSTTALSVSTAAIQTQINNLGNSYISTTAALNYLTTTTASNVYLSTINAASTYLTQSSATANFLLDSSATATYQQQNQFATATSSGVLTMTDWNTFNNKGLGTVTSVVAGPGLSGGGSGPSVNIQVSSVSLSTQVFSNLGTANLNSGLNASATTFWRGDGTWTGVPTFGGAAAVAISSNNVIVSSPTSNVNFMPPMIVALQGSTSAQVTLNSSSVTLQGNTFNGASELVQLTAGSQYPAKDGNLITNLNGGNVTGTLSTNTIPSGSPLYIQAQNSSVQQSTFSTLVGSLKFLNVTSSATVTSTITVSAGELLMVASNIGLDANSYLGVGTSIPLYPIDASASSGISPVENINNTGAGGGLTSFSNGTGSISAIAGSNTSSGRGATFSSTSGPAIVTTSGNVGISSTTPTQALTVTGSGIFSSSVTANYISVSSETVSGPLMVTSTSSANYFIGNGGGLTNLPGITIGNPISGATGNSVLFAGASGTLAQDNANLNYSTSSYNFFAATVTAGQAAGNFFSGTSMSGDLKNTNETSPLPSFYSYSNSSLGSPAVFLDKRYAKQITGNTYVPYVQFEGDIPDGSTGNYFGKYIVSVAQGGGIGGFYYALDGKVSKFSTDANYEIIGASLTVGGQATITGGILGSQTNASSTAGNVGENISSKTASATNLPTSTQYGDLVSVALTSGAWIVTFQACEQANGATLTSAAIIGISTTSGNSSSLLVEGDNQLQMGLAATTGDACQTIAGYLMTFNSNTTVYAKMEDVYSVQTPRMVGRISAIRPY